MADGVVKPDRCVRVGTWNVWWKKPDSKNAEMVTETLAAPDCDILCVTEAGDAGILPKGGHVIDAGTDWGYEIPEKSPGRRKVLLWSKRPWTPVFDKLQDELPGGRLVAGVTETPVGKLTVVGVCIPWRDAHVNSGRRDRERWQDHLAWLAGFERLTYACPSWKTIILGDFNQRIPKGKYATKRAFGHLSRALCSLKCSTEGEFAEEPAPLIGDGGAALWKVGLRDPPGTAPGNLIDHIAHSEDLTPQQAKPSPTDVRCVGIFPREQDGRTLSDHTGVWLDLKKA